MTEVKPGVQERYVTAEGGSEVVIAAGWVSQSSDTVELALMLWAVTHEGKTGRKHELVKKLGDYLNDRMTTNRKLKGNAWKIAAEMLAWHLHGTCEECEGRGYEVIADTPSLSDNMCSHCHGTGKRPYPREPAHIWLADEFARMTAVAGGEIMKRLRVQMDL